MRKKQTTAILAVLMFAVFLLSSCGSTSSLADISAVIDRMKALDSYSLTTQVFYSNDPKYCDDLPSEESPSGYDTSRWSFEESFEREDGAPKYRSHVEGEFALRKSLEQSAPLWRAAGSYQLCYRDGLAGMQGEVTQINAGTGEEHHQKVPPLKREVSFEAFLRQNGAQCWFPSYISESLSQSWQVSRLAGGKLRYRMDLPGAKLKMPYLDSLKGIRIENARLELVVKDGYVVQASATYLCMEQGETGETPHILQVDAAYSDLNKPIHLLLPNLDGYDLATGPEATAVLGRFF